MFKIYFLKVNFVHTEFKFEKKNNSMETNANYDQNMLHET